MHAGLHGRKWIFSLSTTEVVYKAPYRFRRNSPDRLPDPYVQYVGGVDRLIPNLFSQQDQLTLTLEYLGEEGTDDFTADFRPFQSDVVARAFWEAGDFLGQLARRCQWFARYAYSRGGSAAERASWRQTIRVCLKPSGFPFN